MAPMRDPIISHECDWTQDLYFALKKETELRAVVRISWTVLDGSKGAVSLMTPFERRGEAGLDA